MASRHFTAAVLLAIGLVVVPVFAGSPGQGTSKSDSPPPTVRVGGNVKPPIKTKEVKPLYPPDAIQRKIQGVVIVEATIGIDGKVKETKIIRGLPFVSDAAVTAVRGCEFKPTVIDGHPVQVIMTIPINFVLQ